MLKCQEATRLMSQELEQPLGFGERVRLRLHLLICSGCMNFRRQMAIMRNACQRYPERLKQDERR